MTDKQIIVDGCDVSGCEHVHIIKNFFNENTYIQCSAFFLENEDSYCDCTDNPNCNYKQLKRKEQECDVLRKLAETHLAETINMQREIDQLKEELAISIQENEEGREINAELKAENTKLKNNITSFNYLDSLTNEQVAVLYTASIDELAIRGYKAKYNTEVSLLTRYKQALTEIKEICNSVWGNGLDEEVDKFGLILQKCEVLDE